MRFISVLTHGPELIWDLWWKVVNFARVATEISGFLSGRKKQGHVGPLRHTLIHVGVEKPRVTLHPSSFWSGKHLSVIS